ncbi:DHH family phosphoesterase, partial [Candidatus Woesearchaeota archaeon]|nr:DHH family phosphoesterase [Candidatus Woesearchaeota archaeon]
MENYSRFYAHVRKVADRFRAIPPDEVIRIVSHLDADGISSCSVLAKAVTRANRKYAVSIMQKLDHAAAASLAKENYNYFAFTDLGSGQFSVLKENLKDKNVYIFDHHKPDSIEELPNIVHVNPHLFGIDGSKEVSGAGVAYLFAKALDERNTDMAHIAIIGAIGDVQESSGFQRVNSEILADAVKAGKMKVIPGLKVFGAQTKPLHKLLAYSTEHKIPGVTGSESGAIQFLNQLGISPQKGNAWKKLVDLEEEELRRLVAGILIRRVNEKEPEAIIGPVYILCEEEKESPLRDAKEFSTLLNACGRMDKASLGIGCCLGDKKLKAKAIEHLADYKKEIMKSLNWFDEIYSAGSSKNLIKGRNYIIINAGRNIRETMIGTLASIVAKSNWLEEGTLILSMALMDDGNTKVSLRVAADANGHDLRNVIAEIAGKVDGSFGGHT